MGFYAYLDVDTGESLSIAKENGVNEGTPLAAFLGTYESTVTRDELSAERHWFAHLEEQARVDIRILTRIFYGQDMLYSPDEYNRFVAEWGRIYGELSEAEFVAKLEDVRNMWTPIEEVISAVEELIRLLPLMGENTHWYTAEDTQPAFRGLLDTLRRAQAQGGKRVRIFIS